MRLYGSLSFLIGTSASLWDLKGHYRSLSVFMDSNRSL